MPARTRATLRSKYWKEFFATLQFCVFCGGSLRKKYVALEHTYRLVCEKCRQITYTNPKVVAGVVPLMPNGDVILLQREIEPAKGLWSYPAGYMEMGETVQQAAARETWEEVCVKVKIDRLLGIYSYADAGVVTIVYLGRVGPGQTPRPGIESQSVQIFSRKKIPWSKLAFRSTADALRDALRCAK